jgi:hypothetical protein
MSKVIGPNTLWVLASSSHEERHLTDIIFGFTSLISKGVNSAHIRVFVDHPLPDLHLNPYGVNRINDLADLQAELAAEEGYDNVVLIIGGHGSHLGIGESHSQISPDHIVSAVRSIQGISFGVIVLTQCYAGIFNYLDALESPQLVVIGATNLNPSVSAEIKLPKAMQLEDGSTGKDKWSANIFALGFFAWLANPLDLDGDGATNLVDAYKYAGVFANEQLRANKCSAYQGAQELSDELRSAERLAASGDPQQFDIDAIRTALDQKLNFLYVHQESWLLHANLAREVLLS